jgi:hypothetical protein
MVAVVGPIDQEAILDRRRVELIEDGETWAKQPYHAAEELERKEASSVVKKGVASANRVAANRLSAIVRDLAKLGYEISACGVLVPEPMPEWTTDEILSVHFRMHKAEGALFPDALCRAAEKLGIPVVTLREKQLDDLAEKALEKPGGDIVKIISYLGKSIGPPWGKDQKHATLAAMIALRNI